jgi:hypothetical protein
VEISVTVTSKGDGSVQSVRLPLGDRIVLGRGPESAVPLDAPGISREHLEIRAENSALFVTDLSSNGSWLNGSRMPLNRKCRIADSDSIELPGYDVRLHLVRAAAASGPDSSPAERVIPGPSRPAKGAPAPLTKTPKGSFTGLEVFVALVILASAALVAIYLLY